MFGSCYIHVFRSIDNTINSIVHIRRYYFRALQRSFKCIGNNYNGSETLKNWNFHFITGIKHT